MCTSQHEADLLLIAHQAARGLDPIEYQRALQRATLEIEREARRKREERYANDNVPFSILEEIVAANMGFDHG